MVKVDIVDFLAKSQEEYKEFEYVITSNIIDDMGEISKSDLPYMFRMLDDDGEVYFLGQCNDKDSENAFIPLDEYGASYGCTDIQYKENGKWVSL